MADFINITVDGEKVQVPSGISVAAAVLGHIHDNKAFNNNTMDGTPRAPYCLMGVCFECMMEINGIKNVQSCLIAVEEGMIINRETDITKFEYTHQENYTDKCITFSKNGVIEND